jgi:hypothetical protein
MAEHVYLLTIILPLATILLIFTMRYWSGAVHAHKNKANEEAYRALSDKVNVALQDQASSLIALKSDVAKLSVSLVAIEKILKDVE